MSNVKKCDRCEAIYTDEEKTYRINGCVPLYVTICGKYGGVLRNYDLCDDCMIALRQFLCNDPKTGEETKLGEVADDGVLEPESSDDVPEFIRSCSNVGQAAHFHVGKITFRQYVRMFGFREAVKRWFRALRSKEVKYEH